MIEADLPIYYNVEYAKDLAEIAKVHYEKQFSLHAVVCSLPSKEEIYTKEVEEFIKEVKINKEISRISFGTGFLKCADWYAEKMNK